MKIKEFFPFKLIKIWPGARKKKKDLAGGAGQGDEAGGGSISGS